MSHAANDDLRAFYSMVKGSRERVFRWLDSLPEGVFTQEHPQFAYGSLRNIHAHVQDCYVWWVGQCGLNETRKELEIPDVAALRLAFAQVDEVMERAFNEFTDLDLKLTIQAGSHGPLEVTRRWLLMHPTTHEFHHKGQMLALGRVLGWPYPPGPDTDLLLPFETA